VHEAGGGGVIKLAKIAGELGLNVRQMKMKAKMLRKRAGIFRRVYSINAAMSFLQSGRCNLHF
jgi:hypothetical protein